MNIKPISYMKQNAANLSAEIGFEPMFVTQNGVDTLVVQSSQAYQVQQEKMAFLELLFRSERDIENGDVEDLDNFLDVL
jgi:hypothetical protein